MNPKMCMHAIRHRLVDDILIQWLDILIQWLHQQSFNPDPHLDSTMLLEKENKLHESLEGDGSEKITMSWIH